MMISIIYLQKDSDMISIPLIYIEVFFLMLTSFLIGYFFAFFYQKSKYLRKINKLQKSLNFSNEEENTSEILLDSDEEIEEFDIAAATLAKNIKEKRTSKKNKTSKTVKEGELDFERLGFAEVTDADNLQKIVGIGPYTEEKLNDIGIYTFDQISKFNAKDIELVTELIQFFPERITNDQWVSKAKMLAQNKRKTRKPPIRMKKA